MPTGKRERPADPFPCMENMTVKMIREYLERKKSVIVPLGVIEQHGYHLPLKTDALIASELGRMIGEKTHILVAPVIYQSFSGGGLPGTINISPSVMSMVVSDTLLSLAAQGFRNFYLFLCHGGSENARALDNALKMLLRTNPAFADAMIALLPIWKFPTGKLGWDKATNEGDWHAGWLETSTVMALAPELVRMDELALDDKPVLNSMIEHPDNYQQAEKIVDDPYVIPRMTQRDDVKIGVMGFPEQASRDRGEKIIEATVNAVAKKVEELEAKGDGVYKKVAFIPEPILLRDEAEDE
ncbi:MAG TPA: creatininase family protein [Planctomycetota bacterium]|nr:creatininase family protein [Planctomycetota bacterium]